MIDVEKWIQDNVKPCLYDGDDTFLAPATERTNEVWQRCLQLLKEEAKNNGVLDIDTEIPSTITSHQPGHVLEGKDIIKGIQTDYPLKRAMKPSGGARMVEAACKAYGRVPNAEVIRIYSDIRKTHNAGVFDVYDDTMRALRSNHLLTGLPDAYARGRIIGDYRRVALYGVDQLIAAKEADKKAQGPTMTEEVMRLREEISEQIAALKELKAMAKDHGVDVSKPAVSAKEAIQNTYISYLAAVKEQDGAAMSLGRMDSFFDIYITRDIAAGKLTESEAQELIDDFVVKLRLVRHLRTPAFEQLFSGNPTWVTATVGGVDQEGVPLVTKTSFRFLHTLITLGPSPEPNLTVLWSSKLPEGFKRFCTWISIQTSSIQYENDDVMRPHYGSDYSIACCVSAMALGKQMQFFGARCNLPKLLLYVLNNGKDELSGKQVGPAEVFTPFPDGPLDVDDVKERYEKAMAWLAEAYANTMNCIHWSHDKFFYERIEMALHDTNVHRFMAYGIAGLSVLADSFSAIEHAKVTPIRDENGLTCDFKIEGDFPKYGNDENAVDKWAQWGTNKFITELRKHRCYRDAEPTLSALTITSNVVYGNSTGATPDGRKFGEPFAPGANPMHCRDSTGALSSLNSVAKLSFDDCRDGISNTFSMVPGTLGKHDDARKRNLVGLIDGYFSQDAQHLNINVLNRDTLRDAVENPEKYPQLTIRVSGYAVLFAALTRDQQLEVISRTFHEHV